HISNCLDLRTASLGRRQLNPLRRLDSEFDWRGQIVPMNVIQGIQQETEIQFPVTFPQEPIVCLCAQLHIERLLRRLRSDLQRIEASLQLEPRDNTRGGSFWRRQFFEIEFADLSDTLDRTDQ